MKKAPFVVMLAAGVMVVAGARTARAQEEETAIAHVPFAFTVGTESMPAGDYMVFPDRNMQKVLQIVSKDGRHEAFTLYEDTGVEAKDGVKADLQFKKLGSGFVLWQVGLPGYEVMQLPINPKVLAAEPKLAKATADKAHRGDN